MKVKYSSVKYPKQFKHWLKNSGLKFRSSKDRRKKNIYSLVGHGFYWRIDCSENLCRSCAINDFDRWANSEDAELPLILKSKHDFINLVSTLLLMEKNNDTRTN